jgi:hypothetical protein
VTTLSEAHAVTSAHLLRDLILIDLLAAPWTVHGVQIPLVTAVPPYTGTQPLARQLARDPVRGMGGPAVWPDGILYGSRFGAAHTCVALWDRAASAVAWGPTAPLGADRDTLARACTRLGIGLRP